MYLVIFRNRKRADIDQAAYDADAAGMLKLAKQQPGYLSFKTYVSEDGEVAALSEWQDEASARGWGRVAEHRLVQQLGIAHYYASYTLYACDNPRTHHFEFEAQT